MSKTIDEKVVSMQFDNRNFEKNVATTMSTLDKLKLKLNLSGASKGLENIDAAAKKVDLSSMGKSAEVIQAKFSSLDVVAVTALQRITNTAIDAGSRIIKALSIDPIMSGFQEYETQINAVQTILANTSSKGTTLEQVNAALDELNTYADKTIYNFTEMTRNIGTFTAAGVDLDKSVAAIKGIANLAAVSGSNSQQASVAMYQLSQALAAGTVKLQDWNSVVNAGMGGQVFQDSLKETARVHGVAIDDMIKKEGSFRETLSKGWLTAEILTETLSKFTGDLTEEQLKQMGYTEQQIKSILEMGKTANDAATKVKTFTQLVDTLKEAAQSGWTQTWQIIIGDFNQAKTLFTSISDVVSSFINKMSDARNNVLKEALGDKWTQFTQRLNEAGVSTDNFTNKLKNVAKESGIAIDDIIAKEGSLEKAFQNGKISTSLIIDTLKKLASANKDTSKSTEDLNKKLKYFQDVVDKVWNGDFKNAPERYKLLADAGYDYAKVQSLVNKTVDGHKLTLEDLSETQLKNIGYTDEEIKKIKALAEEAEKSGSSLNNLIDALSRPNGREMLFGTVANMLQPIKTILKAISVAWSDAFPNTWADRIYKLISLMYDFSKCLIISDDTADKITRTLKGLFAVIDVLTSIVGGGFTASFRIASKILEEVFKALGFTTDGILSITAAIGDALVKIRDWYEAHNIVNKLIEVTVPLIVKIIGLFGEVIGKILEIPKVKEFIQNVSTAIDDFCTGISNWFDIVTNAIDDFTKSISSIDVSKISFDNITKMFDKIPTNVIKGLTKGFAGGAKDVIKSVVKLASDLVKAFCERLGIHSPSTVFIELAQYCIKGLTIGFGSGLAPIFTLINKIIDLITDPFKKINFKDASERLEDLGKVIGKVKDAVVDFVKGIPWEKLSAVLMSGALLWVLKQLVDVLNSIVSPLEGVTKVMGSFSRVLDGFTSIEAAYAKNLKADAFKKIAEAIGILAVAIGGLSLIDTGKLWSVIGAIAALSTILGLLSFAVSKMNLDGGDFAKFGVFVVALGVSIKLMASAIKTIGEMNTAQAIQGIGGLIVIIGMLSGLMYAYGKFIDADATANIDKAGVTILKISASLVILSVAIKLMGRLSVDDIQNGIMVMGVFSIFIASLAVITNKWGKNIDKLGSMILKVSASLILFSLAIKLMGILSLDDLLHGVEVMGVFVVFIGALTAVTSIAGEDKIAKVGGIIMAASASLILLAVATKILGELDMNAFGKGLLAVTYLGALMSAFLVVCDQLGPKAPKVAMNMLAMSVSIGILAGISVLLSMIDEEGLKKGITAVGALGLIMTAMIAATKFAKDVKGSIMMMSVAIATMAVAVAALSFIDTDKLMKSTTAMVALITAFSIMSLAVGTMDKSLAKGILAMTVAISMLAAILYGLCELPVDKALPIAESMSILILSLSASCLILAGAGSFGPAVMVGIGSLLALITSVGLLMAGLGGLVDQLPQAETFLKKGIKVLSLIGKGLGEFFGNIVSGFLDGVLNIIPDIGLKLSQFWVNASVFFLGLKVIGNDTVDSMTNLVAALMMLTGADLLQKISSWLTGGLDMDTFSTALSKLGTGLAGFAEQVKDINADSVKNASKALLNLANASKSMPKEGGWLQKIVGNTNIEDFGNKLTPLGNGLRAFSDSVKDINADAVKNASEALVNLANASKSMPKQGGWLQKLVGEIDMSDFGTKLESLGSGLQTFSTNTKDINSETMSSAIEALKSLIAIKPPKSGGFWQMLVGESSLGNLGTNLEDLGKGLNKFGEKIQDIEIKSINAAIKSIKSIVKIGKDLDDVSFDAYGFSRLCISVGDGIKQFINSIKGTELETITSAQKKVSKMKSIIESLVGIDTSGVKPYINALNSLGRMSNDSILISMNTASTTASKSVNDLFSNLVQTVDKNKPKTSNAFVENVVAASTAMQGKTGSFNGVGLSLVSNLVTGIKAGEPNASSGASSVVSAANRAIKNYYNSFYSSGKSLTEGFVSGIRSMTTTVSNAAATVASVAANALHKTLKINSPSKVTRKDGKSFGEGFVLGIRDKVKEVSSNASEMATQAISSLEDGLSLARTVSLNDISYDPTISPVVDLANVRAGFEKINTMFGAQRTLAMAGSFNVQSNSQMMRETVDTAVKSVLDKINQNGEDIGNQTYVLETHVDMNGREIAKASAKYTQEELNRLNKIESRKRGNI